MRAVPVRSSALFSTLMMATLVGCGEDVADPFASGSASGEDDPGTPPASSGASTAAGGGGGDDTTSIPGTSTGSDSGHESVADSASDSDGLLLDVGGLPPPPPPSCGCGNAAWSYLWVANSDGTVSKINTRELVEEGRYSTSSGFGDPSRTSVSIDGRAMVVANRWDASMVKIWAQQEYCEDRNLDGVITTSTGPADVKGWAGLVSNDECVAWSLEFPGMTEERPVQWTAGTLNPETCEYEGQKIWTVTFNENAAPGTNQSFVHLVDGDSGTIEETIPLPYEQWDQDGSSYYGAYGGAVDGDGNFFFHRGYPGTLGRVQRDTLALDIIGDPTGAGSLLTGYGITVDTQGRVWFSARAKRVDFDTAAVVGVPDNDYSDVGGLAEDREGRMWLPYADQNDVGVYWVDLETLAIGDIVVLIPGGVQASEGVKGVSVDVDGYIWAVPRDGFAYRIDPETYDVQTVGGLDAPYTYSDMTGGQLATVNCPTPAG